MKTIIIDGVEGVWTPINQSSTGLNITEKAAEFIAKWEGFRSKAYQDPVGVWTIGYGHTAGVKSGDTITEEQALELLEEETTEFMKGVQRLVKVPLTNNQLIAITSFAYNLGLGALGNSTLLKILNNGKTKKRVAEEFPRWVYAGGKKLQGLVRRRVAEQRLFLRED